MDITKLTHLQDWPDAKLSLSTTNPSISGCVPELGVQLLKFKQPVIMPKQREYSRRTMNKSLPPIRFNSYGQV